jgi:hypothetical protein
MRMWRHLGILKRSIWSHEYTTIARNPEKVNLVKWVYDDFQEPLKGQSGQISISRLTGTPKSQYGQMSIWRLPGTIKRSISSN